ncbi:hypothetical protein H0H92_008990 [Tricholoma furcatifolium]|nr:hypothetical protein H0H92_008990 [Tricholoma furcatifolium]
MSTPTLSPSPEVKPSSSPVISKNFCALDADVIFQSSDGIRFLIHRKNLETHAGGFPPSEFQTLDEVVVLEEDAATLELLFQFVYPRRLPDVATMAFEIVYPLAKAAEKYEVCLVELPKFDRGADFRFPEQFYQIMH